MITEKNTDTIGMNIKRSRKEAGMTQEDLAKKTYIQRTTISKYEKGVLTPTPENLIAIEKTLKLKAGTLVQKVAIAIPDSSSKRSVIPSALLCAKTTRLNLQKICVFRLLELWRLSISTRIFPYWLMRRLILSI